MAAPALPVTTVPRFVTGALEAGVRKIIFRRPGAHDLVVAANGVMYYADSVDIDGPSTTLYGELPKPYRTHKRDVVSAFHIVTNAAVYLRSGRTHEADNA